MLARYALAFLVVGCWSSAARASALEREEARGAVVVEPPAPRTVEPLVLDGAVVLTAAGQRFEPGYVVTDANGRIAAVGQGPAPSVEGARRVDVRGRFLTPGLIDTHSHLGVYPAPGAKAHADGNEMTSPTTPGVWAEHSVWPQDPHFEVAVAGGVTTLQILPGSANLIGGRGAILRPLPARGGRAMRFPGAPVTVKMACGENPKRVYGERSQAPQTRMGNTRGHREAFLEAESYLEAWSTYETKRAAWEEQQALPEKKRAKSSVERPVQPKRDLDQETLALILTGQALPQVHCYRADDMLTMLQVAEEFGFSIRSFHHAVEAYKIADVLAAEGVSASMWPDWWGFKLEAYDGILENAAILSAAGGRSIIHSDSASTIRRLNQETAKAWSSGRAAGLELSEDEALRWVTANPAWALGIDAETGTLEVGKRADLVVWDAHPFSVYARAQQVYIDGQLVYEPGGEPWSDFSLGQEVPR